MSDSSSEEEQDSFGSYGRNRGFKNQPRKNVIVSDSSDEEDIFEDNDTEADNSKMYAGPANVIISESEAESEDDIVELSSSGEDSIPSNNSVLIQSTSGNLPPLSSNSSSSGEDFIPSNKGVLKQSTSGNLPPVLSSNSSSSGEDFIPSNKGVLKRSTSGNLPLVLPSNSSSSGEDSIPSNKGVLKQSTSGNLPSVLSSNSSSSGEESIPSNKGVLKQSTSGNLPHVLPSNSPNEVAAPKAISANGVASSSKSPIATVLGESNQDIKMIVSQEEFDKQKSQIDHLRREFAQTQQAIVSVNLNALPDKGRLLLKKRAALKELLENAQHLLANMEVGAVANLKANVGWEQLESGVGAVIPRTFGKKGLANFNAEKHMTLEKLDQLHNSLKTRPTENDVIETPRGVKVELMVHQKQALAWLQWRENQKPSGGILADDMGLGKTLTMICLVIESLKAEEGDEENREKVRDKYPGGTLVVCPASLINQWSGEIEQKLKRGMLSFEIHHGPKRETIAKRLAKNDVVITTYGLVQNEAERRRTLFGVRWRRIILDEAHQIRNHKSLTATAVCGLSAKSRWALTGTPVHNKELDMYALLKFLRCSPFDDEKVWKHWVGDKGTGGGDRLHAVISSLMLRRTKTELMGNGNLRSLPERKWELIPITLNELEMDVYQRVMLFSKTLFAQFLHQRAEKNNDAYNYNFGQPPPDPNGEYTKMRNRLLKMNGVKEISQHHILVLLLRLRQICCHPCLISKMLEGNEDLGETDGEEDAATTNLMEMLNNLTLNGEPDIDNLNAEPVALEEASKGFLNPSNPVFAEDHRSSKIDHVLNLVVEKISTGDKAIIVSQWRSLLNLVAIHLKRDDIKFLQLDGSIAVNNRMPIVDKINDPKDDCRVLLLSLTAGGVGLNLVGANHLFLLDLHWNPQLENQAQDRIYRMGQTKPIFVYKFMASNTIEERIKALQDKKLDVAEAMLTGSKKVISNKLTLQELKLLFQ